MISLSYVKSSVSHWFLHANPTLRHLYMRWIRQPYILHMAAREEAEWKSMGLTKLSAEDVRQTISGALSRKEPFAAAKIGANELFLVMWCLKYDIKEVRLQALRDHAGLFPHDLEFYRSYGELFMQGVKSLDLLGIWKGKGEPTIYEQLGLKSRIANYQEMVGEFPAIAVGAAPCWLPELKGYRVMVVSSFADLINERANEADWNRYWAGRIPWIAPSAFKAVTFPYGFEKETQSAYRDSIDLLDQFKAAHQETLNNSDIVLLGCGAYAIPLVQWARENGKVAIHMGGEIQVVFGIKGGRWDQVEGLYNEHWVRPGGRLKPSTAKSVEDGCYW